MNDLNSSSNSSTVHGEEWSPVGGVVASIILATCFVVGAPGNILVVWTIVRHLKRHSHTVLLLLHLAVADLLVLITLPLWIYSLAWSWVFGEAACKAMVYVIYSCMYASVFLITVMSVERFLAVRYPFQMLRWKNSNAMTVALALIWVLAFLLGLPAVLTRTISESADGTQDCFSLEYNSATLEVWCSCLETLIGFVVPFLTLAVCYCQVASQLRQMHRTKQKSAFLISAVVVAFSLCWLPHHILNITAVAQLLLTHSDEPSMLWDAAMLISGALTFISSSVNPMLYAFAAKNFQGGLRQSAMVKLFQEVTLHTAQVKEPQMPNCANQDTQESSL